MGGHERRFEVVHKEVHRESGQANGEAGQGSNCTSGIQWEMVVVHGQTCGLFIGDGAFRTPESYGDNLSRFDEIESDVQGGTGRH